MDSKLIAHTYRTIKTEIDKTVGRLSESMSHTLSVDGMACDGCEANVEDALAEVPGVERVKADHESAEVTVDGDVNVDALVDAISEAGYDVSA